METQTSKRSQQQFDDFDRQIIVSSAKKSYPNCSICSKIQAKYTCPGCQQQTCSLYCSKKHKKYTGCLGVKSQTQYIPKKQYQENDSKRDYNYLLTTLDGVDRVKKQMTGLNGVSADQKSFKLLKKYGKEMYQIDVKIAPYIMQKHRQNISFFFVKTNQFFWVFELSFLTPLFTYEKHITQPTCDNSLISSLFSDVPLSQPLLTKYNINTQKSKQFHIFIRNRYRYGYLAPDSHAFDKQDYLYIEVDPTERIVDILKGLTIYEFPSLHVVHQSLIKQFCCKYKSWTISQVE